MGELSTKNCKTKTTPKEVKSKPLNKNYKIDENSKCAEQLDSKKENNDRKVTGLRNLKRIDYDEVGDISDTVKTRKSRSDEVHNLRYNIPKETYAEPLESTDSSTEIKAAAIKRGTIVNKSFQKQTIPTTGCELILDDNEKSKNKSEKDTNNKNKPKK